MGRPHQPPVGLAVARAARTLTRAFEDALAAAGGSQSSWLVLLQLKINPGATQKDLAEALELREATMTHHLSGMERDGLITRRRDPANRRVHQIELTEAGEAAFHRLRTAATEFDERLRAGVDPQRIAELGDTLATLVANVQHAENH
ncbi:MarR family winged helix-turn-helix transcriptional regulator [Kutzneria buriramensis]|uniref:MarR family transcriptional regulator for hemolysin n=1 Tax=Kutzneria buriramensis TaxID=1045776 RepID=A0A3E0H520_9PSEU|nr:MarR family transcriptional regulator [Kutzneria buriramensis]REH37287.1 MarR family transcriptional regulator for hemolysin [Kutzneria buriramensis]